MTIRFKCPDCDAVCEHNCRPHQDDLAKALYKLYAWVPEGVDKEFHAQFLAHGRKVGWLGPEEDPLEDDAPFFGSQGWSYAFFGSKEVARSFHAYLDNVVRAAGLDPHALRERIERDQEEHREEMRRREELREQRRREREAKKGDTES